MNTTIAEASTVNHPVVSRDRWVAERKTLLAREKELTRLRDQIARERRALPWVRIEKNYVFDGPEGRRTLAELFEGRRQLLVQHFMFGPGWEQGCPSCSFMADHIDGMNVHLAHRDVTFVAISRAPLAEIERFRQRMGWQFKWVSSHGSDFNHDFHVCSRRKSMAKGEVYYNYGMQPFESEEAARHQRVLQGRRGRGLSHLLDLPARCGGDDGHVQPAGPHAQGPRRARRSDGLGAPPRSLRAGTAREAGACGQFVLRSARLKGERPVPDARVMASLWPWLAVAGLGALHGLNPANGWMFAAAWGVRSRDRSQALRALMPLAVGHAASVALVAAAVAVGPVDGSRCAASPGGRAACRRRRSFTCRAAQASARSRRRAMPGWRSGPS